MNQLDRKTFTQFAHQLNVAEDGVRQEIDLHFVLAEEAAKQNVARLAMEAE